MNINWYGQTCFRVTTQKRKNGPSNVLFDPFIEKGTGLRSPKIDAEIIMVSNPEKEISMGSNKKESPFLISEPGEYDVREAYIKGIQAYTKNKIPKTDDGYERTVIYTMEAEDMKVCHLGRIGQKELTPDQLERIGEVDILLIPVGGGESLEAAEASKIMSQIEPKVIIPMYYNFPKLKVKLDDLKGFLKVLGIKSVETLPKLSIKKKDLPEDDEAKIVALTV